MTIGRVYIAVSKGFPGRIKLGCTLRTAKARIGELQRHYGTRHKFAEVYSLLVHDPYRVESLAHHRLRRCRDYGTEMFGCTLEEGVTAIEWAADEVLRNPRPIQPRPERAAKRWRTAGNSYSGGIGLLLAGAAMMLIVLLAKYKPVLPGWLPESTRNAAALFERL